MSYWGYSDVKYNGLLNQGSTCYLNSVLQVLYMNKDFREALKRHSCDADSLDSHLKQLFDDLSKYSSTYTYKITKKLGITTDSQADAAECLENILNNVSSPEASQLFKGCLTQKNKCSECKAETESYDPFWSLPLELVEDHGDYSVAEGITKYFSESDVSGPNQLFCDACEAKTDSTIKSEMKHHPNVLTLLLKRFKYNGVKIERKVQIPSKLQIPSSGSKNQQYELYAFVEHSGSLRSGYYTATIKSQDDGKWYRFNDDIVTLLSFQPFQVDLRETSRSAYLLFYRKDSAADTDAERTTEVSTSDASKLDTRDKDELGNEDKMTGQRKHLLTKAHLCNTDSAADTDAERTTEVSTSDASKLDTSDKDEKDRHDVKDKEKRDDRQFLEDTSRTTRVKKETSYWGYSDVKYNGLLNQGSTCYLNSVLQVLYMNKDFREALKRHSCDADSLDRHLKQLFDDLSKYTSYTYKITKKLGITTDFVQADAAECLENILNNVSSPEASQLFKGCLTQKNKCSKCKAETESYDPFWSLPLELVEDHGDYSVAEGITKYFSESDVSGPNQLFCDACEAKTDSTIKSEMKHHPDVLTLLLKRFKFDFTIMGYIKIERRVQIPYKLQIPSSGSKNQQYELYAFVEHFGSLRSGHYTATIKSQDDGKWYRFNDDIVTLLSFQPFQVDLRETYRSAYLLFYRKDSAADTDAERTTEVSTSDASKLDTSDKDAQARHDVKDKEKRDDREVAAVNHQSGDRQVNEEKTGQRKRLLTKADLCNIGDDSGERPSKQKMSIINQEQKVADSSTTCKQHEQEREKRGDDKHIQMKTHDEHSKREEMDVTKNGSDKSDADHHSMGLKDQKSENKLKYLVVKETVEGVEREFLVPRKDLHQKRGDGDDQENKQNVEHESKNYVGDKSGHCPDPCASELNKEKRESNKEVTNLKTSWKSGRCADNEVKEPSGQFSYAASGQRGQRNYTSSVSYTVKAYHTHHSFQSDIRSGMPQVGEVGVKTECDHQAGDVESLSHSFRSFTLEESPKPQMHGNKNINVKIRNSTDRQSESAAQVSSYTQVQDDREEPHASQHGGGNVCSRLFCTTGRRHT